MNDDKPTCEFCKKELSAEKLETLHGCLDCHGSIYWNQTGEKEICIHCIEIENIEFRAALESMHIDDCGWDLDKLDIETARGWHKSNNTIIENILAKYKKDAT